MKINWLKVSVAAGIIFMLNSAWVMEGTDNNCAALERLEVKKTNPKSTIVRAAMNFSNGALASAVASRNNPYLPTALSCNVAYWSAL